MATAAPRTDLLRVLSQPLSGLPLVLAGIVIWLAGAAYCHGYQRLLSGAGEWPGSLTWSAMAVVPWFALFEWSKQPRGIEATRRPVVLIALVIGIAALSIGLEYFVNFCLGEVADHLGMLVLRRLPPIGVTLLLIAVARQSVISPPPSSRDTASLASLAKRIEYVAAADNYIELHLGGRVVLRRMTLTEAANALDHRGFVRIHRRFLVNRDQIDSVHLNGRGKVRLRSGAELSVGRAFASNVAALR
jgi:hypothetical protein